MDPDREEIENLIDGAEADMDAERKEIKRLVSRAQAEIEVNPVEFMEPGNVDLMTSLWESLDKTYRSCVVKFEEWQEEYQSILDASVETALQEE